MGGGPYKSLKSKSVRGAMEKSYHRISLHYCLQRHLMALQNYPTLQNAMSVQPALPTVAVEYLKFLDNYLYGIVRCELVEKK